MAKNLSPSALWRLVQRLCVIILGSTIAALGYSLFQVPYNLAAGGVSGISILAGAFTGWPMGSLFLLLNLPLMVIGFTHLGRWRFLFYTVVSVLTFSFMTDVLLLYLPAAIKPYPITHDMLLSAIYAGIVGGIGIGLVYRAGGNPGGTSVLGQLLHRKTGIPLSQVYLYVDGITIIAAGFVFNWEIALHAILTLFLCGIASDFIIEGPSVVRNITIITKRPEDLTPALMKGLNRTVSHWTVTGGYSGQPHAMIMCTIQRSQVNDLRYIVATVDPHAFVIIGNAHQALGTGFMRLRP
jgi:uncharacterized membrane-anchored protein YitT (DUF2179 family)